MTYRLCDTLNIVTENLTMALCTAPAKIVSGVDEYKRKTHFPRPFPPFPRPDMMGVLYCGVRWCWARYIRSRRWPNCDSGRVPSLFDLFDHHAQAMSQTQDEKYHLITRRLQEILGKDAIKALLDQGKNPKCYWGMSTVSIWVVKWLT